MPRILVCAPSIRPGGGPGGYTYNHKLAVESTVADLLEGDYSFFSWMHSDQRLRDLGVDSKPGRLTQALSVADRYGFGRLARKTRDRGRFLATGIAREFRSSVRNSDVVVFHGPHTGPLLSYARMRGKRIVYMPHSPQPTADEKAMLGEAAGRSTTPAEYRYHYTQEEAMFRQADVIVFPSPSAAAPYRQSFAVDDNKVSYLPSAVEGFAGHIKEPDNNEPLVSFLGRYVEHKGYDLYCAAAEHLVERGERAKFVSAGTGPLRPTGPVEDLGWTEDPGSLISKSAVVVVPNRVAYFDLLPLEVASLGTALVMTPVGGNVDQARLLPDAVLADAVSPSAIAEAIALVLTRLRSDPTIGLRNRDAHKAHYSLPSFARNWDALLMRTAST